MIRLLLLGTAGCHLCEEAEEIINACLPNSLELAFETIDIAEEEQWQEHYAIRIPVIYHPETRNELGWPFDQLQVEKFFIELSNG